jgi:hypothetical protein
MRLFKFILVAVVVVTLTAYAFDCAGMTTPEQAMQCCNSMPCPSQGHHGQDCCKTMEMAHAPFLQPASLHSSGHGSGFSLHVLAVLAASVGPIRLESMAIGVAACSHAPPLSYSPPATPLRI